MKFIPKKHINNICKNFSLIPAETFFETMVDNESQRFFDDLNSNIKSNAEVIRDMIEMDIDASNAILNPISPFLSFSLHLEHYFDKGVMYLNSPAENVVEALGLSEAQTKAVYFPVNMDNQFNALTIEEKKIIHAYGAMGYDGINDFLEQDMATGLYPDRFEQSFVSAIGKIRSLLKKLPSYQGVAYRGGMIESDVLATLYPGDLISHKKFLSCSTDEMVAQNFKAQYDQSGMIYRINLTKSGHAISDYTLRHNEAEVLVED